MMNVNLRKKIILKLVSNQDYLILIERRIYPVSLFVFSFILLFVFQVRQFKRLYERIRNDKYLVGQRLMNFERNLASKSDTTTTNNNNNNN
jgi:hypothetical protein